MEGEAHRDHVSLRFESDPRLLCVARSAVRRFAELAGFSDRRVEEIVLAVDESLTNVIRHCYAGSACEPIELDLWLDGAVPCSLVVCIRDLGPPFPAGSLKPPEEKDPEQPGGLGLRLIHEVMDRVDLSAREDGRGNVLTLRTACPAERNGGP